VEADLFLQHGRIQAVCGAAGVGNGADRVVGEALIKVIEHTLFKGAPKAQIEDLFGRLDLIAPALAAAGILILIAGLRKDGTGDAEEPEAGSITRRPSGSVTMGQAGWMGFVQGLALPFRGFSRSGSTISTGCWWARARNGRSGSALRWRLC